MITWGISANSHDGSLAVFEDNEIVFASHTERFSGIKNDPNLNWTMLAYAKNYGLPDKVVWYEKPFKKSLRQLRAGQGFNFKENNIKRFLQDWDIHTTIEYSNHHESHAAAGFYTSKFKHATILVLDSIGEFECLTVWEGFHNNLTKVYSKSYPHSIGLWYSAMTQRIGLKPNEDEYILMGMAAYGDPKRLFKTILNDFINENYKGVPAPKFKHNLHRGCRWWRPELNTWQDKCDIAAATQAVYEYLFENIVRYCAKNYGSDNLVIMGGCALNCVANTLATKHYNNVWIMPNPGDAGSSIGAVLAKTKEHIEWKGPFLGYNIKGEYPVESIIQELQTRKIVGVANGRAEFGPRALGNRSLLADPRGPDIKDKVNGIKQRQKFRPFAPAILAEYAPAYFTGRTGPYMQYTAKCKSPELYPAIVHADGTSRVQTVGRNDNPGLRKLLEEWYKQTGCPMLLNTSLNIKGKPMVNDELDAKAFAKMYDVSVYQ